MKPKMLKDTIHYVLNNNFTLSQNGLPKITLCIEGHSGIGKTSIVEQVAKELGYNFVKLVLSQIEQVGDLCGFPQREYLGTDGVWYNEQQIAAMRQTVDLTDQSRTTYCKPAWVPNNDKNSILLLDDWTRAPQHIIQAAMELIDRGEYISWKLPQNCTIILSQNPENGEYLVTSLDDAQSSRYIKVELDCDAEEWAEWAMTNGIDEKCVTFLLESREFLHSQDKKLNPRLITKFFHTLASLPDYKQSLDMIQLLGQGSVGQEFTTHFVEFINDRLDKIPSSEWILNEVNFNVVENELKSIIGNINDSTYRSNVASTICIRLVIYMQILENNNELKTHKERIKQIILSDTFPKDIKFFLIKKANTYACLSEIFSDSIVLKEVLI